MAKGGGKTAASKNSKTARKLKVNLFNGKKVKPVAWVRNALGVTGSDGVKVAAGRNQYVQLEDGNLLKDSAGKYLLWDDIKHQIVAS